MAKKTLVIWNLIPESVEYFVHDDIGEDAEKALRLCHGNFMNTLNSPAVDDELSGLDDELHSEDSTFKELKEPEVIDCKPDLIIYTGFYL